MISANAAVSPKSPTGAASAPVPLRAGPVPLPRPRTHWRIDAGGALWTGARSPWRLNGTRRVSPLHRPTSTGSAPASNPITTGWLTIGFGLTVTKPAVFEWAVCGVNQVSFWMPAAMCLRSERPGHSSRAPAASATLPASRAGSYPYGCLAGILPELQLFEIKRPASSSRLAGTRRRR